MYEAGEGVVMVAVATPGGHVLCGVYERREAVTPRRLEVLVAGGEVLERLASEVEEAAVEGSGTAPLAHPRGSFEEILTVDRGMIERIHEAKRAAGTDVTVLLEGETGVGKELFARAIHRASRRSEGPFVALNAGGLAAGTLESELFGHVRGAYTDAVTDRTGLVETARGGTLFLDEIGEMDEALQVKLLRLLESGEYRRLGEDTVRRADVRVIGATHRDLREEVERGRFRRDLYHRLGGVHLRIPPLRMRRGDVQLLLRHFLREVAVWAGRGHVRYRLDVRAVEALERYGWPGNVRQLHKEVQRLVTLAGEVELIRYAQLSPEIREWVSRGRRRRNGTGNLLDASVEQYERSMILQALEQSDWNRVRAAERLGVPRTTLLARMKRLQIVRA